jgi:hypothetical protein
MLSHRPTPDELEGLAMRVEKCMESPPGDTACMSSSELSQATWALLRYVVMVRVKVLVLVFTWLWIPPAQMLGVSACV